MLELSQLHHQIDRRSLVGKRNYALVYLLTHTPLSLSTILDLTVPQFEPKGALEGALVWPTNQAIAPFLFLAPSLTAALQDWLSAFNHQCKQQKNYNSAAKISPVKAISHQDSLSLHGDTSETQDEMHFLPQFPPQLLAPKLFVAVDRGNFGKGLSYVSGYQILRAVAESVNLRLTPKVLQKYSENYSQTQGIRWQYRFDLGKLSQGNLEQIFSQKVPLPTTGGIIFLAANPHHVSLGEILWVEWVHNLQQAWQKQDRYQQIACQYPEAVLYWLTNQESTEVLTSSLNKAITKNLLKNSRHDFAQDLATAAIAQFKPLWQSPEKLHIAPDQINLSGNLSLTPSSDLEISPPVLPSQTSAANFSRDLIALLLAERRSENTRRAYAKDLQYFFVTMYGMMPHPAILDEFLGQNRFVAIGQVLRYKSHLIEQGLKEATVNRRLAALRSLVNHAQKLGRCDWTLQDIASERIFPYRDTTGLPVAGIRQILQEINRYTLVGKRNYAILRLLWENALRRNEVITCNRADFDPDQRTLAILGKGRGSQKSLITLSIGLTESIQDYLSHIETLKPEQPLFIALSDQRYGQRLSGAALYKLVRQTSVAAGIKKIMSPHRIRHSAITAALDATNGNVRKVQKLSRHKKIDTLMLYDDNRTNAQGEISDLLSNLFED